MTNNGLRFLWITALFLFLDQVSKYIVVSEMAYRESISVLPFFNLTYVRNTGAAFSFLADAGGWQRWFFTIIAIVISIVILIWLKKTPKAQVRLCVAFTLILSGAIGNVIDRIRFGYVVDFLDFHWAGYNWPAFNVADSAIFVGALLLAIDAFFPSPNADVSSV